MNALRGILGAIRQADQKFTLIQDGDRLMVGISGGKDSLGLLYCLKYYQKFKIDTFEIVPCILDLGFPGFDSKPIEKYVKSIGFKLEVIDCHDVYQILKIQQKDAKHLPCSICSRMKKAAINKAAKQLGCNKVAFAHHADDAIETLFMNEMFGGRVATFQAKMTLERADIVFIRPFILVRESEIKTLQQEENIPSFSSHCPNDGKTMREEMKEFLKEIYKKYPTAKENFLTMMTNYEKEVLLYADIFFKIEGTDLSLRPIIKAEEGRLEAKLAKESLELQGKHFLIMKKDKPIGVVVFHVEKHDLSIDLLKLVKSNKKTEAIINSFIENFVARTISPLKIKTPEGC